MMIKFFYNTTRDEEGQSRILRDTNDTLELPAAIFDKFFSKQR